MTLIGAALRFWPVGGLGLTHFDEGIYALVASGQMSLAELIPYAPPGFTILGGLAFAILGSSDSALILVSQVAGIVTIPVVAWLGRRTFGPGAGFASSVFCAFSGPHIAFSRMALTDASFLLAWLLALGAGIRFLERPGFVRALVMGLAVGLAQEFKYNGWLTGGIVIASALLGIAVRPEERKLGSIAKVFGWGGFSAVVAWLVVWPWFAYVEGHGGYSALLRHQQSYLGGFGAWWPNLSSQANQAVALSGGGWLLIPAIGLVCLTSWISGRATPFRPWKSYSRVERLVLIPGIPCFLFLLLPNFVDAPYPTGFLGIPWLLKRPGRRIVVLSWLVLLISSPFYHPYARLWLPLHASHWLLMAWIVADAIPSLRELDLPGLYKTPGRVGLRSRLFADNPGKRLPIGEAALVTIFVCIIAWNIMSNMVNQGQKFPRTQVIAQPGLLAPSDSLRQACDQASLFLPDDVKALQVLVRPPVIYYLSGRVRLSRMEGSEALSKPGNPDVWALVDSWNLRSELGQGSEESSRNLLEKFANHWEVVQAFPTTLSLPTMLDLDPDAARSDTADRNCSLWLLRPRRPGVKK
jgi:4-amino-4-deoxy-L-arabinose transferase-like glycosyltransferase